MFSDRIYQIEIGETKDARKFPDSTGNFKLDDVDGDEFLARVVQENPWTQKFHMSSKVAAALTALASHYPRIVFLVMRLHRNFAFCVRTATSSTTSVCETDVRMSHAFCSPARFFYGYAPHNPFYSKFGSGPRQREAAEFPKMLTVKDVRYNFIQLVVYIRSLIKAGSVDAAMAILDKTLQLLYADKNPQETPWTAVVASSPLGTIWKRLSGGIESSGNLHTDPILWDCFTAALDANAGHHSCALIENIIERSKVAPREYALFDPADPEDEQRFVDCVLTEILPLKCLTCFKNIVESFGSKHLNDQEFENIEHHFNANDWSSKDPGTGGHLKFPTDDADQRRNVLSPERVCYVVVTQCNHWVEPVKYLLDRIERQAGNVNPRPHQLHAMECLRTLARLSLTHAQTERFAPIPDIVSAFAHPRQRFDPVSTLHSPLFMMLWRRSRNGEALLVNSNPAAPNNTQGGAVFASGKHHVALSEFMGRPFLRNTLRDPETLHSRNVAWIPNIHHLVVKCGEVSPTKFHHGHLRRLCEHIALATSRVAPPGMGAPLGDPSSYSQHLKYYCPPVSQCLSLLKVMLAEGCVTKETIEANGNLFPEADQEEMRASLENEETLLHVLANDPTWKHMQVHNGFGRYRLWDQDIPSTAQPVELSGQLCNSEETFTIDPETWGYGPRAMTKRTDIELYYPGDETSALYHRGMPKQFYEHIELIKQAVKMVVAHGVATGVQTRKNMLLAKYDDQTPCQVAQKCYHYPLIIEAFQVRYRVQPKITGFLVPKTNQESSGGQSEVSTNNDVTASQRGKRGRDVEEDQEQEVLQPPL